MISKPTVEPLTSLSRTLTPGHGPWNRCTWCFLRFFSSSFYYDETVSVWTISAAIPSPLGHISPTQTTVVVSHGRWIETLVETVRCAFNSLKGYLFPHIFSVFSYVFSVLYSFNAAVVEGSFLHNNIASCPIR